MILQKIRTAQPLVHCMTNVVVTNFTANGLLAIGASPVMAYAKEEVEEMAAIAGALLLNIGTLSLEQIEAMILAGKAANKAGVPVILDPVGAGATTMRTEMSLRILKEVDVAVLRGNGGEIASLVGVDANVKGVDGSLDGDPIAVARKAAKQFQCIAVVTGEVDVISDGEHLFKNRSGHEQMTKVVGTGCLLGAVIGAFIAVQKEAQYDAVCEAIQFYGIAGEFAYEKTGQAGIGTYQENFLNGLNVLTDEMIKNWREMRDEGKGR